MTIIRRIRYQQRSPRSKRFNKRQHAPRPDPEDFMLGVCLAYQCPCVKKTFYGAKTQFFEMKFFFTLCKNKVVRIVKVLCLKSALPANNNYKVLANGAENAKTGGRTEVLSLSASLMEVASEAGLHWASVRFAGQIREPQATKAEAFEEIWHLQKPVSGDGGWVLAGIQQVS